MIDYPEEVQPGYVVWTFDLDDAGKFIRKEFIVEEVLVRNPTSENPAYRFSNQKCRQFCDALCPEFAFWTPDEVEDVCDALNLLKDLGIMSKIQGDRRG